MNDGGLQRIDKNVAKFLSGKVRFYMTYNRNFICKGSEWLAKFVFCDGGHVFVKGTQCADLGGQQFDEYLKPFFKAEEC